MSRRIILFAIPVIAVLAAGAAWTLMAREYPPGDPRDTEQVAVGSALYDWNCARCHGVDLSGELGWVEKETSLTEDQISNVVGKLDNIAPAHDDNSSTSQIDDRTLFKIIQEGPGKAQGKPTSRMPSFNDRLSEQEIWSIIAFMKSHWHDKEMAAN